MENKIRSTLNEIYFGKTRDIVNGLRSVQPLAEARKTKDLQVTETPILVISVADPDP
jgi:capping protein beta